MKNLVTLRSICAVGLLASVSTSFRPSFIGLSTRRTAFAKSACSARHATTSSSSSTEQQQQKYEYALLFDCDGVILETEELHRLAYNAAFKEFDLKINGEPVVWSVEYYDVLQNTVGGGKPKMFFHFRNTTKAFPIARGAPAPPSTPEEQQALIDALQSFKTNYYKTLLATQAKARPGVLELMDEALADPTIAVGVCSAATKEAAAKTLDITLGPERLAKLDVCILGDDVSAKKPDPMIYNVARERLGLRADQCVVVEDSLVGLRAAVRANMKCIITYTSSTASQDFYGEGAAAAVPELGSRHVTLAAIFDNIRANGMDSAEILLNERDPIQVSVN